MKCQWKPPGGPLGHAGCAGGIKRRRSCVHSQKESRPKMVNKRLPPRLEEQKRNPQTQKAEDRVLRQRKWDYRNEDACSRAGGASARPRSTFLRTLPEPNNMNSSFKKKRDIFSAARNKHIDICVCPNQCVTTGQHATTFFRTSVRKTKPTCRSGFFLFCTCITHVFIESGEVHTSVSGEKFVPLPTSSLSRPTLIHFQQDQDPKKH